MHLRNEHGMRWDLIPKCIPCFGFNTHIKLIHDKALPSDKAMWILALKLVYLILPWEI